MLLNRSHPNFARCLAVSWAATLYTHFRGILPPGGILPGAHFTLRPSLAFSYIGSITARHSSSGPQPNFAAWHKEWNYRTFAEGATHIQLGDHLIGHWPKFLFGVWYKICPAFINSDLILKDCVCSVTSIHAVQNLRTNSRLALRKRPFTTLPCFWQLVHKTKLLLPPLLQTLQGFLLCPAVLVQPKITFISLFSLSASKLSATGRRHSENQPET